MGMTYEQFWEQSPSLVIAYRKAYRLRREVDNENAWIAGLYMYDAFAVALANAFRSRGAKKEMYAERPIDIFPLTEKEKKRREQEEFKKMNDALQAIRDAQQREKRKKQGG